MGSSSYLSMSLCWLCLFLVQCSNLIKVTNSSSPMQPLLCKEEESTALLLFKQSFSIEKFASTGHSAYPKVASWKLDGENSDCCLWDGVECDKDSGHVISLNLSSSFLYGSINSSSSLFNLVNLQRLNLGDNHFNDSKIPSAISKLSRLTSLDLLASNFSGQIPSEVLGLSKLTSLVFSFNRLKLHKPGFSSLVENLTSLQMLHLSDVDISSAVPHTLANLSSLTSLILRNCGLYGQFPIDIFHLNKLQVLSVRDNQNLTGYLPEFNQSIPLKELRLASSNFSGNLPYSIGNLNSLIVLDFTECEFSGSIPASIGNLTELTHVRLKSNKFTGQIPSMASLSQLNFLSLAYNKFDRGTLPWLGKLAKLTELDLAEINLYGSILLSLANLTQLSIAILDSNHLTGQIPSQLMNQSQLRGIDLSYNQLQGPIPSSFSRLTNFQFLDLSFNRLSGTVELEIFYQLKNLTRLVLSENKLTVMTKNTTNTTLPQLRVLELRSCNLRKFSIPSLSIYSYDVSNNKLNGEIPAEFCSATSLNWLDLSDNNLGGKIPPCLGNLSKSLSVLNLRGNNFQGTIPQTFQQGNTLRMIDLSENQLQGKMPRSLASCTILEILNLGNNQIEDTFPFWLGALPRLQILILRSNRFYGAIGSPKFNLEFPHLHIIDLSYNVFTGELPLDYFQTWKAMTIVEVGRLTYMHANISYQTWKRQWNYDYEYSLTMTNKGIQMAYDKIQTFLNAIDLSSNKFGGKIPECIGYLRGLELLNLSSNALVGSIPLSLGNLTNLESLDLSQNKLSGEIPQQLTLLTFLSFFNVSRNHLTGRIPHGKQFDTFQSNSYEGNLGLCGNPLSKNCGDSESSPPPPPSFFEQNEDSEFPSNIDWIIICTGFGSGLAVGLVIGHTLTTRKHEWFVKTFGRRQQKWRHERKRE
ncbi:receptor-like protein 7 [Camellia sinensis]|uniref:receptor-like protein 7 n=1 Tax=Camellia sinensis TaxID=4442 RepID=UPI00103550C1|nr:receptor-like protein 7 [Camellia sinensis]